MQPAMQSSSQSRSNGTVSVAQSFKRRRLCLTKPPTPKFNAEHGADFQEAEQFQAGSPQARIASISSTDEDKIIRQASKTSTSSNDSLANASSPLHRKDAPRGSTDMRSSVFDRNTRDAKSEMDNRVLGQKTLGSPRSTRLPLVPRNSQHSIKIAAASGFQHESSNTPTGVCPICWNDLSGLSESVMNEHVIRCSEGPIITSQAQALENAPRVGDTDLDRLRCPTCQESLNAYNEEAAARHVQQCSRSSEVRTSNVYTEDADNYQSNLQQYFEFCQLLCLVQLGSLGNIIPVLLEHRVLSIAVAVTLDEENLQEMGVADAGLRRRFVAVMQRISEFDGADGGSVLETKPHVADGCINQNQGTGLSSDSSDVINVDDLYSDAEEDACCKDSCEGGGEAQLQPSHSDCSSNKLGVTGSETVPPVASKSLMVSNRQASIVSFVANSEASSKLLPSSNSFSSWAGSGRPPVGCILDCPRRCRVPETNFCVDWFKSSVPHCRAYFLTHFHADHYGGLKRSFKDGYIYCSETTGHLVSAIIKVPENRIRRLPMNTEVTVDGTPVTLIDAGHCPGSVMFLFKPSRGNQRCRILHSGDMRYNEGMASDPSLLQAVGCDSLYLDTTYCSPQYCFPTADKVVAFIVDTVVSQSKIANTTFVVGSYTIGKERCFLEPAKAVGIKVFVHQRKKTILSLLNLGADAETLLTTNQREAKMHVMPMGHVTFPNLFRLHRALASGGAPQQIIAFRPTGWAIGDKRAGPKAAAANTSQLNGVVRESKGAFTIYSVPYSEHSSFPELRKFVRLLAPKAIVPTVNAPTLDKAGALVRQLLDQGTMHEHMD